MKRNNFSNKKGVNSREATLVMATLLTENKVTKESGKLKTVPDILPILALRSETATKSRVRRECRTQNEY
jgi:hypothetical protein